MVTKIAFLSRKLDEGGLERFVSNLSMILPSKKFEKHIILFETKISYPFCGQPHVLGCPHYPGVNPLRRILNLWRRVRKIRSLKRKYAIDTVISVDSETHVSNLLAKTKDRIILSAQFPKSDPDCYNKGFYNGALNSLVRFLGHRADLVIAISKGVAWDCIQNLGVPKNKVKVIYSMHDFQSIQDQATEPLDVRFEGVFQDPVILTAGRLCKQKGQWHLIRSFALLKKRMPEARLMILGDGEHKEYLISLSKGLGLRTWRWEHPEEESKDKDVYFMGFQNNPFTFYKRASVFAFPSLFEGFGYVLTEAMVCGTPVVSADCRFGPREILAPGTDFLYETKVPEYAENGVLMPVLDRVCHDAGEPMTQEEMTWAEVLYELVRDPKRRAEYAARGQRRSLDFDKSKILSEWIECLA